jgi:hypothetical protein
VVLATDSWIYLDLEKTGCTFLRSALRKVCAHQVFREDRKHALQEFITPLPKLMTVREPTAYYFSLWSYGLDRKGGLRWAVEALDQSLAGRMYGSASWESFSWFLDYVLHSSVRYPSASRYDWLPMRCDLYTARLLSMIVPVAARCGFLSSLAGDFSAGSFIEASRPYWPDVLLRTSSLNADFHVLASAGSLGFLDLRKDWDVCFPLEAAPLNQSGLSSGLGRCRDEYWTDDWIDLVGRKCAVPLQLCEVASRAVGAAMLR